MIGKKKFSMWSSIRGLFARKIFFLFLLLLGVVCFEIIILLTQKPPVNNHFSAPLTNEVLTKYADDIITKCSSSSYRPSCYDKEIPKTMDYMSMEDAFKVTRITQDKDSSYQYCHVLAHNLSAREVQKDFSKWKELVSRCPSGMCSNGCIHGGFQERFRAESLSDPEIEKIKPDLESLCEERTNWHPTGLEQSSCYHAMGHLVMYITSADVDKSINLCKEIALKKDGRDLRQLCFDGVFMQIFQPLEPEDFALVKGKQPSKENVVSYCKQYDGQIRGSCLSERWPLYRDELQKPEGLVKFCSESDKREQGRCYSAIIYVLVPQFAFDETKIITYCQRLHGQRKSQCFANSASRMIETDYRNIDESVKLCTAALPFDSKGECFEELLTYSTYNFHAGSEEFYHMCNALPNLWREKCLENKN